MPTSSAQDALLRVHERILEGEFEKMSGEEADKKSSTVITRLLVPTNQVGCVLGKGGRVIERIRKESGSQIRVLPRDQLPACASSNDEVVQGIGSDTARSMSDYGRGLPQRGVGGGLGSGTQSAIVTNTTVEVVVPDHVIGSVYGENGSNLAQIRLISGAKVILHDPAPGATEGLVIISGTPEQTHAAQSLLQAFILSGQSSP